MRKLYRPSSELSDCSSILTKSDLLWSLTGPLAFEPLNRQASERLIKESDQLVLLRLFNYKLGSQRRGKRERDGWWQKTGTDERWRETERQGEHLNAPET